MTTGEDAGQARSVEDVFTEIYRTNGFGGSESVSGPGSDLASTAALRAGLADLLREIGARSLLDAPCGDFNWMKEVPLELDSYVGVDVVAELVARNRERYGNATRTFLHADILRDPLPCADVIFCRDCLVHLPLADCRVALQNFKRSGSRWLLTTSFIRTEENVDITAGSWRQLNLEKPPFDFPPPHRTIDERNVRLGGIYADKRQALWEISSLPL